MSLQPLEEIEHVLNERFPRFRWSVELFDQKRRVEIGAHSQAGPRPSSKNLVDSWGFKSSLDDGDSGIGMWERRALRLLPEILETLNRWKPPKP